MSRAENIEKSEKIIFLDFDGVLNNVAFFLTNKSATDSGEVGKLEYGKSNLCQHNVDVLRYILEEDLDIKIVFETSWRGGFSFTELSQILVEMGIAKDRIIDSCPAKMSSDKCHDVSWWLDEHKEEHGEEPKYVIIDDYDYRFDFTLELHPQGKFLKTQSALGLNFYDAVEVLKYFNSKWQVPSVMI